MCFEPDVFPAPSLEALPPLPKFDKLPSGMAAALRLCPALRDCPVNEHPIIYPVIAHRNRLAAMAKYVASLAASGHAVFNESSLLTEHLITAQGPMPWQPRGASLGTDKSMRSEQLLHMQQRVWARCTCIIVSDFNTTFPAGAKQGDPSTSWSLEKHGRLREVVNRQWPGHVAWVNNPEPFSSALANTRGWSAIPTDPERSIVHISVADLVHTGPDIFDFAMRMTQLHRQAFLPVAFYLHRDMTDEDAIRSCARLVPPTGAIQPGGSGIVFAYLDDIHRSGGYDQRMLTRSEWGDEDWDMVCALQRSGVKMPRYFFGGFCHVFHPRNYNRNASPDGM